MNTTTATAIFIIILQNHLLQIEGNLFQITLYILQLSKIEYERIILLQQTNYDFSQSKINLNLE